MGKIIRYSQVLCFTRQKLSSFSMHIIFLYEQNAVGTRYKLFELFDSGGLDNKNNNRSNFWETFKSENNKKIGINTFS